MTKSILLVGVGGQGTILAGKLLTAGLMAAGCEVKMSEIHGMSQRGGSVSTHVRYGDRVDSPVIERGGADALVAFEAMEALRWLEYLRPEGRVIVNAYQINPMPVVSGMAVYADTILSELQAKAQTTVIKAFDEAVALGSARVLNVILLGAAVEEMGLGAIDWNAIIDAEVRPAFTELNKQAMARGRALAAAR